ncbi:MAG: hypothetical protein ACI9G6_000752, partial [Limisphaerales bacterium]
MGAGFSSYWRKLLRKSRRYAPPPFNYGAVTTLRFIRNYSG